MRGAVLGCLLVLLAAGCAPTVLPPGPASQAPRLTDDAVIAADGARLPLRRWAPIAGHHPAPKAVILAVHGFNDHAGFFADPGVYFATRGIVSYAYDQRGFGAAPHVGFWPGVAALTGDLKTVAGLIRARHPGLPLYLVGVSMGGGIILTALAEADPPRADGAVLVGPAVWGRETMPWYQTGALWVAAHTAPGLRLTGRQLGLQASDNIAMLRAIGHDPLFIKETRVDAAWGVTNLMDAALAAAPRVKGNLLVLYGARDEIIPEAPTRKIGRAHV